MSGGPGEPRGIRIIAGAWRGRSLKTAAGLAVRPTADRTREALFNRLAHGFSAHGFKLVGARVIDLCAGTGALGLEAASRGAAHVVLIERDPAAMALIRHNIAAMGAEDRVTALSSDATALPSRPEPEPFDLALLDPPYDSAVAGPALAGLVRGNWLRPGALAVVETAASSPPVEAPGFTPLDRRPYGRAALTFLLRQ